MESTARRTVALSAAFSKSRASKYNKKQGAIDQYGETVLDIGVIAFDADTAVRLLKLCDVRTGSDGQLAMHAEMHETIMTHGLDFYREICCVLGTETTKEQYVKAACDSGSRWPTPLLQRIYQAVSAIALVRLRIEEM